MNTRLLPALAFALLPTALAATGEVLDARPATLMQVLTAAGYKATLRPGDAKTSPSIVLTIDDEKVYLYFSDCTAGLCTRVTASNGFDVDKDDAALAPMLADWNANWYSQAYLDKDGGAYVDASYLLTGGYTRANFTTWLKDYLEEMDEFANKLP